MKFNYTAKSAIDLPCEKSSGNGHWTWQSEWLPGSTLLLSQCLHELCTFCPLGLHFLISKIPSRRKEEPHLTSWELTFNALCSCYALSRVRLLCNPMNCTPPGCSVLGISQVRILGWVAMCYCRGSSWLQDQTWVSCISCTGRWILYHCTSWGSIFYLAESVDKMNRQFLDDKNI